MTTEPRWFTCNLCEAMCGVRLDVDVGGGRVVGVRGDEEDPFSRGHVCPKVVGLRELHEDPDRVRTPLRRTASGWEPISWDGALAEAATRLRDVQRRHGRDAVGFYVGNPAAHSLRASLGAAALTFALRTRNRFDANSQDANPRTFASLMLYGDPLAVPVPDVDRTDLFVVLGANPAVSGGSLMSLGDVRGRLAAIRARGARLVVIDPRRTETAALADRHHFIRPGGDAALLFALLQVLFAERLVDEARVEKIAAGLGELRGLAALFPPERVAGATGLLPREIRALAREIAAARTAAIYGRLGTCQSAFGPMASWLVDALAVVTGNFDREGGVLFTRPAVDLSPLGRLALPSRAGRFRSRVRGLPELLGALPSAVMAEEMETEGPGRIRAFVTLAGNPVLSTPNGPRLSRALSGLDFMVSIDIYLNETTRHADLVLPPISALETGNYDLISPAFAVRNFARYSAPALPRPAGGRDDWEIAGELALRLGLPGRSGAWLGKRLRGVPDALLDALLRLGPHRLSLAKLRAAPHGIDLGPLAPSRDWRVRAGERGRRVRLAPAPLVADVPRLSRWVDERAGQGAIASAHAARSPAGAAPEAPLELIGRRHVRSNNSWMHNVASLAKGPDRSQLWMHPSDAARLGLVGGDRVRVRSRTGQLEARLFVTDDVMPGVVSLPHGFGHAEASASLRVAGTLYGASANAITDELQVEPVLGTSILNGVAVMVEIAERREAGPAHFTPREAAARREPDEAPEPAAGAAPGR